MRANECTCVSKGATTVFQTSVPQRPRMNHVWPDFQSHCDIRRTSPGSQPSGVIEQGLVRANLDQHWRKISELGEERRNTRILPVDACGQIRLSQFVQIFLVNEWIDSSLAS